MTYSADRYSRRSQHLTNDKILIDRKTFDQLFSLVNFCAEELVVLRDCEIFLTFLHFYLSQINIPEVRKSLLPLGFYSQIVPDGLQEIAGCLEQVREILNFIAIAKSVRGR